MAIQAQDRFCPLVKRECARSCAWRAADGFCMIPWSLDGIAANLEIIAERLEVVSRAETPVKRGNSEGEA